MRNNENEEDGSRAYNINDLGMFRVFQTFGETIGISLPKSIFLR